MIDINKGRNNFEKFPTLKQKCDTVVLVQPNSSKLAASSVTTTTKTNPATTSSSSATAATAPHKTSLPETSKKSKLLDETKAKRIGGLSSISHKYTSSGITNGFVAPVNPVRAANQPFFLVPAFQDKNFLKEECEIAHAQVTSPERHATKAHKQEKDAAASEKKSSRSEEHKINSNSGSNNNHISSSRSAYTGSVYHNNNHSNSNNNNSKYVSSHNSASAPQSSRTATTAAAALTNGMRRSGGGNGNHSGVTTTNSTVHKVDIVFNHQHQPTPKIVSKIPKQSLGGGTALTFGGSTITSKLNGRQVKPLVHRSIPSTAVAAAANTISPLAATATTNKLNNNNNNNSSGNKKSNSHSNNNSSSQNHPSGGNNNSMQHSLDHDDIKYIDSDEPAPLAGSLDERKPGRFEPRCCTPSTQQQQNAAVKNRTRPKSTIICTPNNFVFEKVNNYKYANGSSSANAAIEAAAARRNELRRSGIDPNSIKASIEKFNSFSEQKRAVTMRSHGASGSTSNLQNHRYSSEFSTENSNLARLANNAGGSLTRTPYRTTSVSPAPLAPSNKVTLHNANNSIASSASSIRSPLSSSGNSTNSLPLKGTTAGNRNLELGLGRTATTTTTDRASASSLGGNENSTAHHHKQDVGNVVSYNGTTTTSEVKKHTEGDTEDSIRSTTLRIPPPPPSPTTSRYWDREISKPSSALHSSTAANNVDEGSRDEKSEGLCGLRNIGNTCFMNSVIQCLSHTNELTKFLRTYNNGVRSTSSKDQLILLEFSKLIREMWTANVHSVTPMELKRAFSTKHRMYSDYNQQDAQEFLRFFLDSLHCALNSGVKGDPLKIDDNLSDNKKADLTWEWYARHENSIVRDLFVGQLKSTLRCTACGNTSVTFDPFWDLSVPLPSSSRCKLDACLDLFIREEVLDGDEMPTCSKCRTRRKCTKSFTIQRFPKYLVIHLKRFSETRWSKLSNIVEFPTGERELNMGPYGSNPATNIYYSLYAISNHMGSTAGGHYVALCRHPVSRKWHEFNDNIVSEALSENHLVSSSAYILFYERS